jgi:23S rRNA (cytidine1920-2'-O)/16S rRNA (cytidine1409-2'-O)-methyltransferase
MTSAMALKERADKLMVDKGLAETRSKAQALIMEGHVFVDGKPIDKAGMLIPVTAAVEVVKREPWVSRGAHKLLHALKVFSASPRGKVCTDIGASTGGFTQVLLAMGAQRVYAVDVGYGQLAWSLRKDPRVIAMERTNARYLKRDDFAEAVTFITVDASFISLRLLISPLADILPDDGEMVALVKPQFEAGRERVGKGGVVRDAETHAQVLRELGDFINTKTQLALIDATFSPIKGPKGNVEFFFFLKKGGRPAPLDLDAVVVKAVEALSSTR